MNSILEQFRHFCLSAPPYEADPAAQTERFFAYNEALGARQVSAERAAFLCDVRYAAAFPAKASR